MAAAQSGEFAGAANRFVARSAEVQGLQWCGGPDTDDDLAYSDGMIEIHQPGKRIA